MSAEPSDEKKALKADLTVLLGRVAGGDDEASHQVFAAVHSELHRMASRQMRGERADHTLQGTALVNEAWLRMRGGRKEHGSRAQFFAAAARAMRHALVEHARGRGRKKRGGDLERVAFDVVLDRYAEQPLSPAEVIDLNDALVQLERLHPRQARVFELHIFTGLTLVETAEVVGISRGTVESDVKLAREWLRERLSR